MYGIQIKSQFLDLYPNTVLSIELNSPLYFGSEVDVVQGSFMYSISVPLTPRNNRLLNHPSSMDNAFAFLSDEKADIYAAYSNVVRGALTVLSATPTEATIKVVISATQQLKDTPLNEFLTTKNTSIQNVNIWDYALQTCHYPQDQPFIFHPVLNEDFDSERATTAEGAKWQNAPRITPDPNAGNITTFGFPITPYTAMTPFFRLNYVLEEVVKESGFWLNNTFQNTDELRQLTMYNNRTLLDWGANGQLLGNPVPTIKAHYHLPSTKTGEWLRNIMRQFNQGLFIDNWDNQIDIIPANALIGTTEPLDWTEKLLSDINVTENKDVVRKFNFEENTEDFDAFKLTLRVSGDREYKAKYMSYPSVKVTDLPIHDDDFAPISAPNIKNSGSWLYFDAIRNTDFNPRLMLYRGLADSNETYTDYQDSSNPITYINGTFAYPLACCEDLDAIGNPVKIGWNTEYPPTQNAPTLATAQHSLNWKGEKGLFVKFWREWHSLLSAKREIKASLALTAKDIQQFNFKRIIRLKNREYFVKRMKFNASKNGLHITECELVSTIHV